MSNGKDSWDGGIPNLSKLPAHIRDAINAPVPVQKHEVVHTLHIFKNTQGMGLNMPNARMRTAVFRNEKNEARVQIDIVDPKGKVPILTALFSEKDAKNLVLRLVETYVQVTKDSAIIIDIEKLLTRPADNFELNKYTPTEPEEDNSD